MALTYEELIQQLSASTVRLSVEVIALSLQDYSEKKNTYMGHPLDIDALWKARESLYNLAQRFVRESAKVRRNALTAVWSGALFAKLENEGTPVAGNNPSLKRFITYIDEEAEVFAHENTEELLEEKEELLAELAVIRGD